jgi:membrane protease YdiL (CAAX protease family)
MENQREPEDQTTQEGQVMQEDRMLQEKKLAKNNMNAAVRGIFFYMLIFLSVVFTDMMIKMVNLVLHTTNGVISKTELNQMIDSITKSGASSILGGVIGIIMLFCYFKSSVPTNKLFIKTERKMTGKAFFVIIAAFMLSQLVFDMVGAGIEYLANLFGYSFMQQIESASMQSETISMSLYAILFGPIIEELVFRGFLLRSLQPFGRKFAVIMSALMFGLFHGNLPQGIFAMAVGIVLGYVATEYSIVWSMLIHIMNNLYSELLGLLVPLLPKGAQSVVTYAMNGFFFVAGVLVIWKYRKKIKSYIVTEKIERQHVAWLFTNVWMILFTALCIGEIFLGITKL